MKMSVSITECFCIWSDLLGFGNPFQEAQWTFRNERALENVQRLQDLSNCLYRSADPLREVALVLNDGLARVYDVPEEQADPQSFLRWLHSILVNHWQVNALDQERGRPGLRSVFTFGERVATWNGATTLHEMTQFSGPRPTLENRTCIYSPHELQLNLAFSKAYTIESIGSQGGISGPALFVDETALAAITKILTARPMGTMVIAGTPTEIRISSGVFLAEMMVTFDVARRTEGDLHLFEIFQATSETPAVAPLLTIEFESTPIPVDKRGILTKVWKVRRYQPIDEPEPFYFDFSDYRFASTPGPLDLTEP